jgi:hypothetical protein
VNETKKKQAAHTQTHYGRLEKPTQLGKDCKTCGEWRVDGLAGFAALCEVAQPDSGRSATVFKCLVLIKKSKSEECPFDTAYCA